MIGCVAVCVAVQVPCSILTSQAVVTTSQFPYLGQHGWGDTKLKGLQNAYSSGQPTDEGLVLCTRDVRTHFRCALGAPVVRVGTTPRFHSHVADCQRKGWGFSVSCVSPRAPGTFSSENLKVMRHFFSRPKQVFVRLCLVYRGGHCAPRTGYVPLADAMLYISTVVIQARPTSKYVSPA